MKASILIFLFMLFLPYVDAAQSSKQPAKKVMAECIEIPKIASLGDKYYKLKKYDKARLQYWQQARWSESCQLSKEAIATAYNNVALTYIHQSQYLKAKFWLKLLPNDKKSIFNSNKISNKVLNSIKTLSDNPEGEYWHYIGRATWNVITIKKMNNAYQIDFQGYYFGSRNINYGPNMGEFSTQLEIVNGKALYSMTEDDSDLDCVYNFNVTDETLSVKRISGSSCGFGLGVGAGGLYYKVENP